MSTVNNLVNTGSSRVWHGIEKMAAGNPNGARVLSLPIAVASLVRDTLFAPAGVIEEIYLIGKSIKMYVGEKDENLFLQRIVDIGWHSGRAVRLIALTPIYPLYGLIKSIVTFAKFILNPLATAKIEAAQSDFNSFVGESKDIKNQVTTSSSFASPYEFAKAAFERFKTKVAQSKHDLGFMAGLHFLDTVQSKQALMDEIDLKKGVYKKAGEKYSEILESCKNSEVVVLDKLWKEFQIQLIKATPQEASSMTFEPML